MSHVLAITLQKGGTAKTTTCINLATYLALSGARTLLVDMDPQANGTQAAGVTLAPDQYTSYEVLLNPERDPEFAIIKTKYRFDLLPATFALAGAEIDIKGQGRELKLRQALAHVLDRYDYIIIDCPPNLGLFTLNALAAANAVIIPLQLEIFAYRSIPQLELTIELVRQLNPELCIGAIICTMYDARKKLSKSVERQARTKYGQLVLKTVIPDNTKIAESPAAGEPIFSYDPNGPGSIAYAKVTQEVIGRYGFK